MKVASFHTAEWRGTLLINLPSKHLQCSRTAHSPESSLTQPKAASEQPSSAILPPACNVPESIDDAKKQPSHAQCRRRGRILQSGKEHKRHRLRHVLQEIAMRSLGTIEFVGCLVFLCLLVRSVRVGILHTCRFAHCGHRVALHPGEEWDGSQGDQNNVA